jgi:hypothetical protein
LNARQKLRLHLHLVPLVVMLPFYDKFFLGLAGFLSFLVNYAWYGILFFLHRPDPQLLKNAAAALNTSVLFFVMGGIAYFSFYEFSLFVVAQFALPVTEWGDRIKAWKRLRLFTKGNHGPAIFVRGGERVFRQGELDSTKPGVALVDLSSAVALVQHDDVKSMSLPSVEEWESSRKTPVKKKGKSTYEPKEPEVKGPGVVFTEKGQKIDDAVDLRKQTRATDPLVEVYTRNGIKVNSKVTVVFSLSDSPEKMWVGYVGGKQKTDLKIFRVSQTDTELTIKGGISMDADDAADIISDALSDAEILPLNSLAPYLFYPDRVKSAIFNQARDKDGKLIAWHEAPLETATDIFRKMLSAVPYDRFFSGSFLALNRRQASEDKTEKTTIQDLKDDFALSVKARGLVAFQLIEQLNGQPFSFGQTVKFDELRQHPPMTLTREKFNFFRHMGIVVKSATFGDVLASDSEIQDKMLEAWKAKMEREVAVFNAEYELEAIRVRNRNRALAQEEMTHLLSGIFQSTPHFDEALALRVLQALETSVSDSEMSSTDLHEILKNIHDWLLADGQADDDSSQKIPPKQG